MSALTVRPRPQPDALDPVVPVSRRPRWADLAVLAVAVGLGTALRIRTRQDLWVDEAISVSIARLSVPDLLEALRNDGHPPVYYLLLHAWMDLFGESAAAVRIFSAAVSVATLPVAWIAGRRLGGRRCAIAAVVLMAVTPSVIRLGSETRMYSLVVLFALLAWLAARRAYERPSAGRLLLVTLVTGLLVLTHYWAFFLVAGVLAVVGWGAVWGPEPRRRAARRLLVAVGGGVALFLPWLPVFVDQLDSTGTPWGIPARPAQVVASLLMGGGESGEALVFGVAMAVLALLGLLARPLDGGRVELNLRTRAAVRAEVVVMAATLALATAGGYLGDVAFVARYTAVVLPLLVLVCAFGVTQLPSWRWRDAVLAGVVVLGLVAALEESLETRTQAPDVAAAIEAGSTAGELVAYCPSQLGPGVSRLLPDDRQEVTFPDLDGASRVNWTDYLTHVRQGDPRAFAAELLERAGDRPLWLVWAGGHFGLGRKCEDVVQAVGAVRPEPTVVVTPKGDRETAWLYRFPPPLSGS